MWVSIGEDASMPETLILLHGFAGTGRMWDPVIDRLDGERYRALAPDIRGHGSAHTRRPINFESCAQDVVDLVGDTATLCGYSMGGRIALHAALAAPQRFDRLVLIATTAGIGDVATRAQRAAADEQLARFMETHSIEEFADRWSAQPLFADTPPESEAFWRANILDNHPTALAAAMRGLSAGWMGELWDRLGELTMPATVVVGENDARFAAFGRRLVDGLPDAGLVVVPGVGHGIPRDAPGATAHAIADGQPR
jgi:2-succinyl-6-hydroxy-2,4-cyclohexadiene-1-carboxylate synthase